MSDERTELKTAEEMYGEGYLPILLLRPAEYFVGRFAGWQRKREAGGVDYIPFAPVRDPEIGPWPVSIQKVDNTGYMLCHKLGAEVGQNVPFFPDLQVTKNGCWEEGLMVASSFIVNCMSRFEGRGAPYGLLINPAIEAPSNAISLWETYMPGFETQPKVLIGLTCTWPEVIRHRDYAHRVEVDAALGKVKTTLERLQGS